MGSRDLVDLTGTVRSRPRFFAVIAVGLVARLALLPVYQGRDFVVWDLASRAALRGTNIYAQHPPYPGGPYAYFPLFVYVEVPMRWLAGHIGVPFTVLGKLPIVGGDVLAAAMIARRVWRSGYGDGTVALATAAFFLNPLVLYNGAFYGRFDSLCLGLLLLALTLRHEGSRGRVWSPLTYALSVAVKTFPAVILPWLVRRAGRLRVLVTLAAVTGVLALPFVLSAPAAFISDVFLYNNGRAPANLSWQVALVDHLSPDAVRVAGYAAALVVLAALVWLTRLEDVWTYSLVALLLLLLVNRVVLEQYLLWPMPFVLLRAVLVPSRAAWAMAGLLTAVGMLINPYIHPLGEQPTVVTVPLAMVIVGYAWSCSRDPPRAVAR